MKDFFTESEAHKMWCPHVERHLTSDHEKTALQSRNADLPPCIGSKCMAWRWSHTVGGPTEDPTGFCGAFGLPRYV